MAVVIDSVAGSPTANSFTDVAFADQYNANQLYAADWAAAATALKQQALITATRLIVSALADYKWRGWATSSTQALPFPRRGLLSRTGWTISELVIPAELQQATAELARQLITAGKLYTTASDAAGIRSLSAGSVSIVFDGTVPARGYEDLPSDVWAMINFLTEVGGAQRQTNVPLVRW